MNGMIKGLLGVAVMGSVLAASAQNVFPLKVDVDVSTKRSTKQIGAGDEGSASVENVQVLVKVRKDGGQAYTEKLTAELYVIGKQIQTGYLCIIDVVKEDFYFTKENKHTYKFTSKSYALGKTDGNINVGGKYETYLVVIVDKDGKTIATRSGRIIRERGIAFIREQGPETLFDRDGNVIGKLKHSGQAFEKAVPIAIRVDNNAGSK